MKLHLPGGYDMGATSTTDLEPLSDHGAPPRARRIAAAHVALPRASRHFSARQTPRRCLISESAQSCMNAAEYATPLSNPLFNRVYHTHYDRYNTCKKVENHLWRVRTTACPVGISAIAQCKQQPGELRLHAFDHERLRLVIQRCTSCCASRGR